METASGLSIQTERKKLKRELTLLPLFGLLYFTVCGGSFGAEPMVGYSGPGLALLLMLVTPLVFSIPNMLVVRELQSMMPAEGGYYHWVKRAFGPFLGFMAGWNNWVVSWLDVSIYPVWAAMYLSYFLPALDTGATIGGVELSGNFLRWVVSAILIWAISALQIRGARLAGLFTNWLGLLMIIPLMIMSVVGIVAWISSGETIALPFMPEGVSLFGALSVGLYVAMWNFMGWELPAAAGDEIVNPRKTYPRAMALTLVAAIATYMLPTVAGLWGGAGANGAWQMWGVESPNEQGGLVAYFQPEEDFNAQVDAIAAQNGVAAEDVTYDDLLAGSPAFAESAAQIESWGGDPTVSTGWEFPQIGEMIGRKLGSEALATFLGITVTLSAILSMIGLFVGNSLGGSRVPFALAADGMFPRFMVRVHPRFGTPWVAILVVGVIFTIFSWSAFEFLVVADVFLNTLVILAYIAALWRLRFTDPDRPRQRVPGGWPGLVLVTLGPAAIIILAIASQYMDAGFSSIGWALAFMLLGVLVYLPIRLRVKPGVPDVDPYHAPEHEEED